MDLYLLTARELLSADKRKRESEFALVEGNSMWPILRDGYSIQYETIDPDNCEIGDIVVLQRHDGRVVVHRLIGRVGDYFIEAGDNTISASVVTSDRILGKVTHALDRENKPVELMICQRKRFAVFVAMATVFLFLHQCKQRLIGRRKSLILWKLSVFYRGFFRLFGVDVPNLPPR